MFSYVCLPPQSLLQTKLQHPVWAAGPPSFPPLTQRPYGAHVGSLDLPDEVPLRRLASFPLADVSGDHRVVREGQVLLQGLSRLPFSFVSRLEPQGAFCPVGTPFLRSLVPRHPSQSSGCQLAHIPIMPAFMGPACHNENLPTDFCLPPP